MYYWPLPSRLSRPDGETTHLGLVNMRLPACACRGLLNFGEKSRHEETAPHARAPDLACRCPTGASQKPSRRAKRPTLPERLSGGIARMTGDFVPRASAREIWRIVRVDEADFSSMRGHDGDGDSSVITSRRFSVASLILRAAVASISRAEFGWRHVVRYREVAPVKCICMLVDENHLDRDICIRPTCRMNTGVGAVKTAHSRHVALDNSEALSDHACNINAGASAP